MDGTQKLSISPDQIYFEPGSGKDATFINPTTGGMFERVWSRQTKSRLVETINYSDRLLYCYEMPSPMFGDIGEAVTDENGEAIIDINDIFQETVSTNIEYQVFLQKEGKGDIWVQEKHETYFIVKGTENLKFAWEIKVKQRDYEYEKMEEFSFEKEEGPVSVEHILEADNRAYLNKQEEILNENS